MLKITRKLLRMLRGSDRHHIVVLESTAIREVNGDMERLVYLFLVKHSDLSEPFHLAFEVDPFSLDTKEFINIVSAQIRRAGEEDF